MTGEEVLIFQSRRPAETRDRALVLQAVGIPHEVLTDGVRSLLVVPADAVAEAERELAAWQRENRDWRPPQRLRPWKKLNPWPGLSAYLLIACLFAWASAESLFGLDWFGAGRVNAGLVRGGDWWRTVTALTLHVDLGHLSANLVFGLGFGLFAGQYLGAGVAWLAILASGALGNAANAWIQPADHNAVGASTAIFGALGLIAAFAWRRRLYPQDRWVYRLGPIVGAVALLAYTGSGGERTDVGAHLTGFLCGAMLGLATARLDTAVIAAPRVQVTAGAAAGILILAAWWLAFRNWP